MKRKLSEKISIVITFLSGIIFSNFITALLDGQYVMSMLSLLAVIVAILMKRFVDWDIQE
ncbi:MAG: hypothetical protein V1802_00730 [Candidatus Aenigmatarchaeota archaeon]